MNNLRLLSHKEDSNSELILDTLQLDDDDSESNLDYDPKIWNKNQVKGKVCENTKRLIISRKKYEIYLKTKDNV